MEKLKSFEMTNAELDKQIKQLQQQVFGDNKQNSISKIERQELDQLINPMETSDSDIY